MANTTENHLRPLSIQHDRDAIAGLVGRLANRPGRQVVDTMLTEALAGRCRLDGLFGAFRAGTLVGIVAAQTMEGRCASLWLPRVLPSETPAVAAELFARANRWLSEGQIRMAQVVVEQCMPEEKALLDREGFPYLTDLLYLACEHEQFPQSPPAAHLEFTAYSDAIDQRLRRVIEETYRSTLDCPQLNGVRDMEDVLAGYRSAGTFAPERWLLVRHEGEDVGCLLLADYPVEENLELVYMGIAPAWRGSGWGVGVAQHAQWVARALGRARVVLAVDAKNGPAIRMYGQAGFFAWDRREVYLHVFDGGSGQGESAQVIAH